MKLVKVVMHKSCDTNVSNMNVVVHAIVIARISFLFSEIPCKQHAPMRLNLSHLCQVKWSRIQVTESSQICRHWNQVGKRWTMFTDHGHLYQRQLSYGQIREKVNKIKEFNKKSKWVKRSTAITIKWEFDCQTQVVNPLKLIHIYCNSTDITS